MSYPTVEEWAEGKEIPASGAKGEQMGLSCRRYLWYVVALALLTTLAAQSDTLHDLEHWAPQVTLSGDGVDPGWARLELHNPTSETQNIRVRSFTEFSPTDSRYQRITTVKESACTLPPDGRRELRLETVCSDVMSKPPPPKEGTLYTVGRCPNYVPVVVDTVDRLAGQGAYQNVPFSAEVAATTVRQLALWKQAATLTASSDQRDQVNKVTLRERLGTSIPPQEAEEGLGRLLEAVYLTTNEAEEQMGLETPPEETSVSGEELLDIIGNELRRAQGMSGTVESPPVDPDPATPERPVEYEVTEGGLQPVQAVWQDDESFEDFEGKQISNQGPGRWRAELDMVVDKPTVLYGFRDGEDSTLNLLHRSAIKLRGRSNGTQMARVRFRFTLVQNGRRTVLYTDDVIGARPIPIDGPGSDSFREFECTHYVTGAQIQPFTMSEGAYAIEAELIRDDGTPTGLKIVTEGEAVVTRPPNIRLLGVLLSDLGRESLDAESERLARIISTHGVLLLPAAAVEARGSSTRVLVDQVATNWLGSPLVSETKEALVAYLTDRMATRSFLEGTDRTVVLLHPEDFDLVRGRGDRETVGFCPSTKVSFCKLGLDGQVGYVVALHEVFHSLPHLWSEPQMLETFGRSWHNTGENLARGVRIQGGVYKRLGDRLGIMCGASPSSPYWITQGTYWHILEQFRERPDPPVVLVRGVVDEQGPVPVAQLLPAYTMDGLVDLEAPLTGQWTLRLSDREGQDLGRFGLPLVREIPEYGERKLLPFAHRLPALEGVQKIELLNPSLEVAATLPVSPNPPRIEGLRGEVAEERCQITWEWADPDGDDVLGNLLKSTDGGESWELVNFENRDNEFSEKLTERTENLWFKLVITDGYWSRERTLKLLPAS